MKTSAVWIIICLFTIGAVLGIIAMRKEMPYHFDIIQLENAIAINQHEDWNKRDLKVEITKEGKRIGDGILNSETHSSIIEGVGKNLGVLDIRISRMDIPGKIRYRSTHLKLDRKDVAQRYLVLIGASIGDQWNLEDFNKRKNMEGVTIGNRIRFEFNKRPVIDSLVKYQHKPDTAIIKECSAYFPRDPDASLEKIKSWVNLLKENHITPVLATTPPVVEVEGNIEKQRSIDQFNGQLRNFADSHGIMLLDLAHALKKEESNHFIKDVYAQEDGFHLTPKAYEEVLDDVMLAYLQKHS